MARLYDRVALIGHNGAGKTTLANQVAKRFAAVGRHVEVLDGDAPTEILTRGLGVSKEDRDMAVRRLGTVARMLVRHGAGVVVAVGRALDVDVDHVEGRR